jgi:hypothetical protein
VRVVRDPILAGLVAGVRQHTATQVPITIISSGLVAEGQLVAESRWLDELAQVLEAGSPAAGAFGTIFRTASLAVEIDTAVGGDSDELLHLMGAVVRNGETVVATGLWRLRLDAVDGWKLGTALPHLRAVEG